MEKEQNENIEENKPEIKNPGTEEKQDSDQDKTEIKEKSS